MKKSTIAILGLTVSALCATQAMASVSKTREQVRTELFEAIRTGDMPAPNNGMDAQGIATGAKLNEMYPHRYPAKTAQPTKTREQVRAELFEAIRTGDMPAPNNGMDAQGISTGAKLNELHPDRYPAKAMAVSSKTREQVRAEVIEARSNPPARHWSQNITF